MYYVANILTLIALWCSYKTVTLYRLNDADCIAWAFLGLVFTLLGGPVWISLIFQS